MSNSKALHNAAELGSPHELKETTLLQDFMAIIKVGIVNSNLITTFTGLWLALHFTHQHFLDNLDVVFFTLVGSSLVIAGSCSLNNYYDRDIDHLMERTKERPTVTGKVNPQRVLWLGILLTLIGVGLLALTTMAAVVVGLVGFVVYVFLYTMWTKRHYTINTVVGSISGAVPPVIGWAAIDGNVMNALVPWILFLIMFIWQPPHFLALAMRRVEEYRSANIPMLPVVHGFAITKRQIVLWVACLLPLPYYLFSLGNVFLILATILNVGWLALGLYGFKMKDDIKWAKLMFVYSLNYLTIMFVAMVIATID